MGAITVGTPVVNEDVGKSQMIVAPLTFTGTYATGGDDLDQDLITAGRIKKIKHVDVPSGGAYSYQWDQVNQKLQVFWGDNNNAADGPFIEVPATTDLTGQTPMATIWLGA